MSPTSEYLDELAVRAGRQRRIEFDGPRNFRDLGGYPTADGRTTRWGVLYRADALDGMTPADLERFGELGIATVFDLRHDFELERAPDPMPTVNIPVMSRIVNSHDRPDFSTMADAEDGRRFMFEMMLRVVDRAAPELGDLVARFADAEQLPAVFHCTAGKDRTGIVAALVLDALGVGRPVIVDDFALTAHYRAVGKDSAGFRLMVERGAPPEVATGALGAPPDLMSGVLEEIDRRWGGAERYLIDAGGVDPAVMPRLRANGSS